MLVQSRCRVCRHGLSMDFTCHATVCEVKSPLPDVCCEFWPCHPRQLWLHADQLIHALLRRLLSRECCAGNRAVLQDCRDAAAQRRKCIAESWAVRPLNDLCRKSQSSGQYTQVK